MVSSLFSRNLPMKNNNVAEFVAKTKNMILADIETLEKASVNSYFLPEPISWEDFNVEYEWGGCPFLHLRGELLDQLSKLVDRFNSGDEWGVSESVADIQWLLNQDTNAAILAKAKEVA